MINKIYGDGKYTISMSVHITTGNGLAVFISGGERPHLGGVALASPGAEIDGEQLSSCDLWTLTVPGHKDAQLAQKNSEEALHCAGRAGICKSWGSC